MPTGQQLTDMYARIKRITDDLRAGEIGSYDDALALIQQLLDAQGDYIDTLAAAKSYLSSAGLNSQADVGTAQVLPVQGATPPPAKRVDAQGNLVSNTGPLPEEDFPFGAYQRGLAGAGLNAGLGGGEFGSYLKGRAAPTSATFLAQQALTGGKPLGKLEGENAFADYAQQTRGGNLGLQAQNLFQRLVNRGRGGGDPNTLPEADPLRAFLLPEEGDYGRIADLGREASRGRLGGYAASQLLPTNASLISQFRGSDIGAQNQDFLEYMRRAFGL